jgi:hypothetical protein
MAFSVIALSIMILIIMILSIMILSTMAFNVIALRIMTLSITKNATLIMTEPDTVILSVTNKPIMPNVIMLSVVSLC